MCKRLGIRWKQIIVAIVAVVLLTPFVMPVSSQAAVLVKVDLPQSNLNAPPELDLTNVWSTAWFKGKLYVGVPPIDTYPGPVPELKELDLRAQIWRYTPETSIWEMVHISEEFQVVLPDFTVVTTARDMAYSVMAVHTEPGGEEALYIGTNIYYGAQARFLRTTDGENFQALTFNPGVVPPPGVWAIAFKSLVSFNGRLYTTPFAVGDPAMVPQVEVVFESVALDPVNSILHFRPVSTPGFGGIETNIFEMTVIDGYLYVGIGDPEDSYQMWKTDASGPLPYTWIPVTIGGAWRKEFTQINENGFGDPNNSYAWSMAWFKGKLYVGTVRNTLELATYKEPPPEMDPYPVPVPDSPTDLDLRAEIWQYTPETETWARVYQSPEFPIMLPDGTVWTARDAGYRSMVVHLDETGEEALYIGTHIYVGAQARLLRTTDGENFQALTFNPGMELPEGVRLTSFRSLVSFNGHLYTTPVSTGGTAELSEVQIVFESVSRDLVNSIFHFRPVSESGFGDVTNATIFEMAAFNGHLYAGTGNGIKGYQIWKTDASGQPPYNWTQVIVDGAYRGPLNEGTASMFPFKGHLYVGGGIRGGGYDPAIGISGAPELIRVNPDDSWDLIVGQPRQTPDGYKTPLSGQWPGFGNMFNGYFWRIQGHEDWLYLGTLDNSAFLPYLPLENIPPQLIAWIVQWQGGFDLWKSHDGVQWYRVTKLGFDNPLNIGVRTFQSTPVGLFVGSANPFTAGDLAGHPGGAEVWQWRYQDTPVNYPPVAEANGAGETSEGNLVVLDAYDSSDPDYNIILYEWDLDGDGQFDDAIGVTADVVFSDNGLFSVGLRVTDEFGVTDTDTLTVTVSNVAPTVDAGPDQSTNEGDIVSLAPATFNDKGTADTHTATIDWGDGIVEAGMVTETPFGPPGSTSGADGTIDGSHVYADNGSYTVSVTVTDDDGASTTDTLTAIVSNVAPTVDAGPDHEIYSGGTANKEISFSDPGIIDYPWTYTIDWGDGTSTAGSTSDQSSLILGDHVYYEPREYIVEVRITDKDGDTGYDSQTVTVKRLPVVINIKPGSDTNPVNLNAQVHVAILTTTTGEYGTPRDFDATRVDVSSVRFGPLDLLFVGGGGEIVHSKGHHEDTFELDEITKDGDIDLVLHFDVSDSGIIDTTTQAYIWGITIDGVYFEGYDSVLIRPEEKKEKTEKSKGK